MSDVGFKIGDAVRLKSGGPPMTVKLAEWVDAVTCVWFDGSTTKEGTFHAAMLEPYTKPRPTMGVRR
jgi:uncharacterized protein YodC (DUF2158 family)